MKKITISFIIITFIAQNLLWATGERVLMPDSKQAMQELASSIDEVQNPAAAWLRFRDGGQAVDDRVGGDERKSTLFRLMIWLTLICSSLFVSAADIFPAEVFGFELPAWLMFGMAKKSKADRPKQKPVFKRWKKIEREYRNGKYRLVIKLGKDALESGKFLIDQKSYIGICTLIGNAHFDLKEFMEALGYYQKCYGYLEKMPEEDQGGVVRNLGFCYYSLGQYKEAKEKLQKVVDDHLPSLRATEVSFTLDRLGKCCFFLGELAEARDYILRVEEDEVTSSGWAVLAIIYLVLENDYDKVQDCLVRAEGEAIKKSLPGMLCFSQFCYWLLHWRQGEGEAAEEDLEKWLAYDSEMIYERRRSALNAMILLAGGKLSLLRDLIEKVTAVKGGEFAANYLRGIVGGVLPPVDLRDVRETIMELFGFEDCLAYAQWLLEQKFVSNEVYQIIEMQKLISAFEEIIDFLAGEERMEELAQLAETKALKTIPQLRQRVAAALDPAGAVVDEVEVLAKLQLITQLTGSRDTAVWLREALSLIDDLVCLKNLPEEKTFLMFIIILFEGIKGANEEYSEEVARPLKRIISWLEELGADNLCAHALHYQANLYHYYDQLTAARECAEAARAINTDERLAHLLRVLFAAICYSEVTHNPDETEKNIARAQEGIAMFREAESMGDISPTTYLQMSALYELLNEFESALDMLKLTHKKKNMTVLTAAGYGPEKIQKILDGCFGAHIKLRLYDNKLEQLLLYIFNDRVLGLYELMQERYEELFWNQGRREILIRAVINILGDDSCSIEHKNKAVALIEGLNVTAHAKELIALFGKTLRVSGKKSKQMQRLLLRLLPYCQTAESLQILKKHSVKAAAALLDWREKTVLGVYRQIADGEVYLSQEKWDEALKAWALPVPGNEEELNEYILNWESASLLEDYPHIFVDNMRELIIEAKAQRKTLAELHEQLVGKNKEAKKRLLAQEEQLDDLMQQAEREMANGEWDKAQAKLAFVVYGNIELGHISYQWLVYQRRDTAREMVRQKLRRVCYLLEQCSIIAKKGEETLRGTVAEWQDKVSALRGNQPEDILEVAKSFYFCADPERALAAFKNIPRRQWQDNPEMYFWRLKFLLRSGRTDEYGHELAEWQKEADPRIWHLVGRLQQEDGHPLRAMDLFLKVNEQGDRSTELIFDNFDALFELSGSLWWAKGYRQALHFYRNNLIAPTMAGENVERVLLSSSVLGSRGRYQEELDLLGWLQQAFRTPEQEGRRQAQLGVAYQKMGRDDKARDHYRACLGLATDADSLTASMNNLIAVYWRLKEYGDLKETLLQTLKIGYNTMAIATLKEIITAALAGDDEAADFIRELLAEDKPKVYEVIREACKDWLAEPEKISALAVLFCREQGQTDVELVDIVSGVVSGLKFVEGGIQIEIGEESSLLMWEFSPELFDRFVSLLTQRMRTVYPAIVAVVDEDILFGLIKSQQLNIMTKIVINYLQDAFSYVFELMPEEEITTIVAGILAEGEPSALIKDVIYPVLNKMRDDYSFGVLADLPGLPALTIGKVLLSPEVRGKSLTEVVELLRGRTDYQGLLNISYQWIVGKEHIVIDVQAEGEIEKLLNAEAFQEVFDGYVEDVLEEGVPVPVIVRCQDAENEQTELFIWSLILGAEVNAQLIDRILFLADEEGEHTFIVPYGVSLMELRQYEEQIKDVFRGYYWFDLRTKTIKELEHVERVFFDAVTEDDEKAEDISAWLQKLFGRVWEEELGSIAEKEKAIYAKVMAEGDEIITASGEVYFREEDGVLYRISRKKGEIVSAAVCFPDERIEIAEGFSLPRDLTAFITLPVEFTAWEEDLEELLAMLLRGQSSTDFHVIYDQSAKTIQLVSFGFNPRVIILNSQGIVIACDKTRQRRYYKGNQLKSGFRDVTSRFHSLPAIVEQSEALTTSV